MKNKQKAWRKAAATSPLAWIGSGRHKKRRNYRGRVFMAMLRHGQGPARDALLQTMREAA